MKIVTEERIEALREELQNVMFEEGWSVLITGTLTHARVRQALARVFGDGDPDYQGAIGCEWDQCADISFATADMAEQHERVVHGRYNVDIAAHFNGQSSR